MYAGVRLRADAPRPAPPYRPRVDRPSGAFADRLRRVDPRVFDALLALGITVLGIGSLFVEGFADAGTYRETDAFAVALGLVATVPVYWRRTRPLPALVVSCLAIMVTAGFDYLTYNLPTAPLFLVFAVGAYAERRQATLGLVAVNVTLLAIFLTDAPDLDGQGTVLNMAVYSGAWLAGQVIRARSATAAARIAEAEERAETQRQQAARAVAEERLRLAQELHDVVAHSMSVIAVQAGMGVHVIDADPGEAKRALEAISQTSRTTLQEMRRLLGVLRDEDGARSHAPAPGLSQLPALVADVRDAGVPVELNVEGDPADVPESVELSVYRLVQEGLTNVLKHAGPARAEVTVRYRPGEVEVEVLDDGRGSAATGTSGHGLVGMRERVALWGGNLSTGPRQGGGYRVLARLPYGAPT